jgi:hypothetical protein
MYNTTMEDDLFEGFDTQTRTLSKIEANVSALNLHFRKALLDPSIGLHQKEKLSHALRQIYGSSDSIEVHESNLQDLYYKLKRWMKRKT